MASYFNYKIREFLIESLDGKKNINATNCISAIKYYEDLFSPSVFVSILLSNTDGLLSSLPIRGGERVRLIIEQEATKQLIKLDESRKTFYIYKVYGATTESTKETPTPTNSKTSADAPDPPELVLSKTILSFIL